MSLEKGFAAPYQGVLVPEQNYKNYKYFESFNKYLLDRQNKEINLSGLEQPKKNPPLFLQAIFIGVIIYIWGSVIPHH